MCAAEKVVSDMKPSLSKDHLLVSIAAGISIAKLQVDDEDRMPLISSMYRISLCVESYSVLCG